MSARRPSAKQRRAKTIRSRARIRAAAKTVNALLTMPCLDAEQSAFIGQTSVSTVRRACNEGSLRHIRVNNGKLIRIAPDDLRAWLRVGAGSADQGAS